MSFKQRIFLLAILIATWASPAFSDPSSITTLPDVTAAAANGPSIELTKYNSISLVGPISGTTASDFVTDLLSVDNSEVVIYIDSPGGSIIAGNTIITAMKDSNKKTKCVAKFAASMAFIIMQACDERYVTRDGILMQHVASYGVSGQAPNNRSMVNFLDRLVRQLDMEQAERIGLSYEDFKSKTRDDWWLYSVDSLSANTADGIATVTCSPRLIKEKYIKTITFFFFTVSGYASKCPLITKLEPIKKGKGKADILPQDLESLKTTIMIRKLNSFN